MQTSIHMKKKSTKRSYRRSSRVSTRKPQSVGDYLVIVKSWMFLVAFALMLGLGALIGTFVNEQINLTSPQVAGYSVEAR